LLNQSAARQKRGPGEAEWTGANPTDRGKCGAKRHLLTDGTGVPLAMIVSEANRTDMKRLEALLDARMIEMPPLPEDTPDEERPQLCLDQGYDYDACRETARAQGYVPHIPPSPAPPSRFRLQAIPTGTRLGALVVEVAHSWFNRFRRLLMRWEKKGQNYLALGQLAAVLIICRKLRHAHLLSG